MTDHTTDAARLRAWCTARGIPVDPASPRGRAGRAKSAPGILSEAMAVSRRAVQQWLSGDAPVPAWAWRILDLLDHQAGDSPHRLL